jgi:hypothetical protein
MKSGLNSWCRECQHEATRKWRARNRDEINRRRREAYGSAEPHNYPTQRKADAA